MGMKRDTLEWQLSRANGELAAFEQQLDEQQVANDTRPRNAKWRNLNARCRQIRNRLNAVAKVEATNAEVAQRKSAEAAS
jgi:hypothetical protein